MILDTVLLFLLTQYFNISFFTLFLTFTLSPRYDNILSSDNILSGDCKFLR